MYECTWECMYITINNEKMITNLKESKERYMGGFREKKKKKKEIM